MSDVYFICANPKVGKSGVMKALEASMNLPVVTTAVAQCGGEDGSDTLKAVCGFGEGVEGESIVTIGHTSDENEAQPVCGMLTMNGASDGVCEPSGAGGVSDVYFIIKNPKVGKSGVMKALEASMNLPVFATDAFQGGGQESASALEAVSGLGQGAEKKTVVTMGGASDEDEAQPVCGMLTMNGACDGVCEASSSKELIHDAQLACNGGDLGVVGKHLGACGIELNHDVKPDMVTAAFQPSTEGAGGNAGVAA